MRKQPTSRMCFVCGRENPIGLHLEFWVDEQNRVHTHYTPRPEHQGFPGVMHGGLITSLLDETIGRTAIASDIWCMTARLEVRFRKPVPIGELVEVVGEITRSQGRLLEARGELHLADGTLAAEAHGTFVRIPDSQMAAYQPALEWWRVDEPEGDAAR